MKKVGTLNLKTLDKQKYKKINDANDIENFVFNSLAQILPEVKINRKKKIIYYFIYMPDFKKLLDLGYELFFTDLDENYKKIHDVIIKDDIIVEARYKNIKLFPTQLQLINKDKKYINIINNEVYVKT